MIEPAVFLKRLTRHRDNGGQTGNLHMLAEKKESVISKQIIRSDGAENVV